MVRAEILQGCRIAANELRIDVCPILESCGIAPQLVDRPQGHIEKPRLVRFLQEVATGHDCPHYGLLVGLYQPSLSFGPPAHLVKLAPTVRAALENVVRFVQLYTEGVTFDLSVTGDVAHFSRTNCYQYDISPVQLDMLGMVQVLKMLQGITAGDFHALSLAFDQPSPGNTVLVSGFFDCPVSFQQPVNRIAFPANVLELGVPTADEELLLIIEAYFASQIVEKGQAKDVVSRTKGYITSSLGSGACSLESCAQRFHVHPRTLQRDLARRGYTFKNLILSARMELARDYLRESDMPLTEIAEMLGYRNGSAFTRAFKREIGWTPLQWRAKRRGASPPTMSRTR